MSKTFSNEAVAEAYKARRAVYTAKYRANNVEAEKDRAAKYRAENREKLREANKAYAAKPENKARKAQLAAARNAALTPEQREDRRRKWREWYNRLSAQQRAEKAAVKAVSVKASRVKRYNSDPNYKQRQRIHSDMWKVTRGVLKSGRMYDLLGCTLEELSRYIEAQFEPGMSFDNLGEWEVDHIRPLASFDLTDKAQLAQACHYTNTRPRWKADNRGARK